MSDPLSVIGSAVGIISLGLQVCGEIVSFCQAWRGFNEDLESLGQKADGLRVPLRTLRDLIEDFRTTDPAIARDLENKAKNIEQVVKRLKEAIDRYASTTSDPDSLRSQLKRAAYPFRKEGLRDIAKDLDSFQAKLQAALQIYLTQSARASLGGIARDIHEMKSKMPDLSKVPPSLLHSWCAQHEQPSISRSSLQVVTQGDHVINNTSFETNPDRICSGSCRTKATHGTSIDCQNRNPANSACASRSRRPRKETAVISLSYYYRSLMLGFAIRASFFVNKGAGGYSIAPLLHLRPLINARDSVAHGILGTVIRKYRYSRDAPEDFKLIMDHASQQFQQAFDRQEASPFDRIQSSDEEISLFDFACNHIFSIASYHNFKQCSRIPNFLLDCGSKPSKKLDLRFGHAFFGGEGSLGLRLLDLGCFFTTHASRSLAERQSILYLLSRGDESIEIPNIARIILQESEDELRDALKSGTASPNDIIKGSSLINYAFGWPKGIQILLEAGAVQSDRSYINYVEDNNTEDTYRSIKLLIEAGWPFDWFTIFQCQQYGGSGKIKSLLIKELAARCKRLWHLAQSCLPAGQLPKLISEDKNTGITTIFDIHTADIHARLVKQGVYIDPSLKLGSRSWEIAYGSVYHFSEFTAQTLEELYQIGFRGITQVNFDGLMPLVISHSDFDIPLPEKYKMSKVMERMFWLVSKGADVYQGVPGTSATAAHRLGLMIVDIFLKELFYFGEFNSYHQERYRAWKQIVSKFGKEIFLLPSVRDGCVCACSPGGCTTMSVTVRRFNDYFFHHKRIDNPDFWFQELIQFLLWWTKGDTEIGWGVIRFLTFDALGLKHSCCIKTPIDNFSDNFKLKSREEEEVEEIFDEQKLGLLELEKVLDELKIKFDELGQPVMEFLEGYWHTRMIEILSQRDPYDEEHVIKSRQIGVTLEPDECVVPDRVSLLIGSKTIHEIST